MSKVGKGYTKIKGWQSVPHSPRLAKGYRRKKKERRKKIVLLSNINTLRRLREIVASPHLEILIYRSKVGKG